MPKSSAYIKCFVSSGGGSSNKVGDYKGWAKNPTYSALSGEGSMLRMRNLQSCNFSYNLIVSRLQMSYLGLFMRKHPRWE